MTLQYFIVFLKIFQLSTPKSTNKTSAKRKQADQARKTRSGANRGSFWGEKHCKSSIILPAFLVLSEQRVQYHGSSSCVKMSSKLFLEGETCTSFELWLAFGISKSSILVQADSVGPQTVKQLDEAKPTNPHTWSPDRFCPWRQVPKQAENNETVAWYWNPQMSHLLMTSQEIFVLLACLNQSINHWCFATSQGDVLESCGTHAEASKLIHEIMKHAIESLESPWPSAIF